MVSVGEYDRRSRDVRSAGGGCLPALTLVIVEYGLPYVQPATLERPAGNWSDSVAIAAAWMGVFLSVSDAPEPRISAPCSWARK